MLRVAAAQIKVTDDIEGNTQRIVDALHRCARDGAEIAVFPETALTGYSPAIGHGRQPREWPRIQEGLRAAQDAARDLGVWAVVGTEAWDGGGWWNRLYVFSAQGETVATYDKVHLTLGEREVYSLVPGHEIKTFDTRYGRIAIVTCYDIYFPELFVALTRAEPDLIFFPSLQRSDHEMASEAMLRTRAMDTQAYIVRSSFGRESTAPWRKDMMFGQSCVVHPDGSILANAGHYEGVALAYIRVPFDWQRARCGGYPCQSVRAFLAEDRRPDLYNAPPGESLAPSANG